jgi:hypothetical protein
MKDSRRNEVKELITLIKFIANNDRQSFILARNTVETLKTRIELEKDRVS